MLKKKHGTKVKYPVDYKLEHFYKDYKQNVNKQMDKKVYNKFIKELFKAFSLLMIEKSKSVFIPNLGKFWVGSWKPKLINDDNTINKKSLHPDWKKTWEYWRSKYNISDEDIIEIPNKLIIYYENKHSGGIRYSFKWDKRTLTLKGKSNYKMIANRTNKLLLNEFVKNNPEHCYYGK